MIHTRLARVRAQRLATLNATHYICQTGRQQVELRWGRIVLQMRAIDLCVLHEALSEQLSTRAIDAEEEYILSINGHDLCLTRYELPQFQAMVRNATEQLPPHVIRWREIVLSLRPRAEVGCRECDCYSTN